ncbi:GNAT family N-acetyltransferase [Planococcus sp. CP5-4]|uniref:GNAT family N-acetyltransferase n=1 Tax=unclassified Planococcus (in: firmicutes) TaxID=2662419 RepID=UPI001C22E472|nr:MULTISPECIES: GNAT family N-acetyltransferase [unclassified Planococcus (in: firmicutes)]MBU9672312.1 GNAT family N-acetyltransferase [Planococcus sp. CP5-4_YE]MBV0909363.1 GNAT family N-acetyltransferase [Planococcus sp. CP5-4_UN]MBW6064092.1 GNAT family N-acetyltransferase [Planococcus sp. CP5-4]
MAWKSYQFDDFTAQALYNILKLRVEVFVVEQNCPYPELDGLDEVSTHMVYEEDGEVLAYARLVPAGKKYDAPSIGRVIVRKEARGRGLAKELLERSIRYIDEQWKEPEIQLQGQVYLKEFYGSFGFEAISEIYNEDGIPHIDMKRYAAETAG